MNSLDDVGGLMKCVDLELGCETDCSGLGNNEGV